jgi:[ribosomal protein S18]-alanine N-acetyltransferase
METQIRNYTPLDREACLCIFDGNTPLFFDPSERESLVNWLNAKDAERMAYSTNLAEPFYVLELDGGVVGCAGFYIPGHDKLANMVWGMVERNLHKKGLGRQLLEYRIGIVQQHYPDCRVLLDTTQHSYGFFERLGFRVTKITPDCYGPGLSRYDMVLDGEGSA